MIAIDTNVLVRLMVDDGNDEMAKQALALLSQQRLYVSITVMIETHWLLRRRLQFSRESAGALLRAIVGVTAIEFEKLDLIQSALIAGDAAIDFDDALHLLATPENLQFATFDRTLIRRSARLGLAQQVVHPESMKA